MRRHVVEPPFQRGAVGCPRLRHACDLGGQRSAIALHGLDPPAELGQELVRRVIGRRRDFAPSRCDLVEAGLERLELGGPVGGRPRDLGRDRGAVALHCVEAVAELPEQPFRAIVLARRRGRRERGAESFQLSVERGALGVEHLRHAADLGGQRLARHLHRSEPLGQRLELGSQLLLGLRRVGVRGRELLEPEPHPLALLGPGLRRARELRRGCVALALDGVETLGDLGQHPLQLGGARGSLPGAIRRAGLDLLELARDSTRPSLRGSRSATRPRDRPRPEPAARQRPSAALPRRPRRAALASSTRALSAASSVSRSATPAIADATLADSDSSRSPSASTRPSRSAARVSSACWAAPGNFSSAAICPASAPIDSRISVTTVPTRE